MGPAPPLDVAGAPGLDAGNIVGQMEMPPRVGGHIQTLKRWAHSATSQVLNLFSIPHVPPITHWLWCWLLAQHQKNAIFVGYGCMHQIDNFFLAKLPQKIFFLQFYVRQIYYFKQFLILQKMVSSHHINGENISKSIQFTVRSRMD